MVEVFFDKTKLLDNDFLSLYYTKGSNEYVKYFIEGNEMSIKKTLDELKERIINKTKKFNNMKLEQEIEYSYFNDNEYDKMSLKPDALIFENESINNASKKYDKMVSDVFWRYCPYSHETEYQLNIKKITITMTMNNKRNNWFLNLFRDIF